MADLAEIRDDLEEVAANKKPGISPWCGKGILFGIIPQGGLLLPQASEEKDGLRVWLN